MKKKANHSLKTGISFGITSGTITTLGLMVGLFSGTHSKAIVIGGILMIAIADAMSDALGIHVAEEFEKVHTEKEIWISTGSTFLTKFIYGMTFLIPVLLFELKTAVIVSVVYGLVALSILSYKISDRKESLKVIMEHLIIAIIVIIITYYLGVFVNSLFG